MTNDCRLKIFAKIKTTDTSDLTKSLLLLNLIVRFDLPPATFDLNNITEIFSIVELLSGSKYF